MAALVAVKESATVTPAGVATHVAEIMLADRMNFHRSIVNRRKFAPSVRLSAIGILSVTAIFRHQPTSPLQRALLRANSDSLAHNVGMSEKRTKADKAQREADLLDKKSSHRPPQNQGKKPREDFNQAAVRIVEEAAEKH